MPKNKYMAANKGKVTDEHEAKVSKCLREVIAQEEREEESYSDSTLATLVRNSGLLVCPGAIYKLRIKLGIPGSRERKILNFSKRHKK